MYSNCDDYITETSIVHYRICEIEFDILFLCYSLVLSDWEMAEFIKAITTLISVDIFINFIILGRNVCKATAEGDMLYGFGFHL